MFPSNLHQGRLLELTGPHKDMRGEDLVSAVAAHASSSAARANVRSIPKSTRLSSMASPPSQSVMSMSFTAASAGFWASRGCVAVIRCRVKPGVTSAVRWARETLKASRAERVASMRWLENTERMDVNEIRTMLIMMEGFSVDTTPK
jgi:hypothetical protein